MDEIRINNAVKIETHDGLSFEGVVQDVQYDRVLIEINCLNSDEAKKIKELDELKITADTHFGFKSMNACVISEYDEHQRILVENNPTNEVNFNREFMRVNCNFNFIFEMNDNFYNAVAKNLSAGGILFEFKDLDIKIGQFIKIKFSKELFEADFECSAKIIKINDDNYVAQFDNINDTKQSKITKYVFKHVSKTSTGSHIG